MRQREVVQHQRLVLHRDVAREIGGRAADERYRHRKRLVEQPLLAVDGEQLDEILFRPCVDPAACLARIDERAHADLGQRARAVARDVAEEL